MCMEINAITVINAMKHLDKMVAEAAIPTKQWTIVEWIAIDAQVKFPMNSFINELINGKK